jgi:hypothetical protein
LQARKLYTGYTVKMIIEILGVKFKCSDKVLYAKDEVAREYIEAIKKGNGLARKILKQKTY